MAMQQIKILCIWSLFCFFLLVFVEITSLGSEQHPNIAKGASYRLVPSPNYKLTQDRLDNQQLTDGQFSKSYFWKSKKTVGWKEFGPIQIEMDLRDIVQPTLICINTARGNHAKVSYPYRIDIFSSLDKKTFRYQGNLFQESDHQDGSYQVKKFCSKQFYVPAQHVWFFVQPKGHYTFMDEIEIFGKKVPSENSVNYPLSRDQVKPFRERVAKLGNQAEGLHLAAQQTLRIAEKSQNRGNPSGPKKVKVLLHRLTKETFSQEESLNSIRKGLREVHSESLHLLYKNSLVAWKGNPWERFSSFDIPAFPIEERQPLQLEVMSQGTTSGTVNITNTSRSKQQVKVSVQIEHPHAITPTITIREAIPILTVNNEVRADPLLPLSTNGLSLKPGESKQIWLSVSSQASLPCSYKASLNFISRTFKEQSVSFPLFIHVRKAKMPQKPTVYVTNWAYLNWRPIQNIPKQAVKDLLHHHTNVFVIHPRHVPWPQKSGDKLSIDYSMFDKTIQYHPSNANFLFLTFFNNPTYRTLQGHYEFLSPEWEQTFNMWIRDWVDHIHKLGLRYDQFALYIYDEPQSPHDLQILKETAKRIKAIDPHIRIYTTLPNIGLQDLLSIAPYVDVYQLKDNNLSGLLSKTLKLMNKQVWSYSADGGGKSAHPLGFYRIQAWKAVQAEVTGIGFWSYADTGSSGTAWNDRDGTRPDYSVIYEGSNSIISSKRWEAWLEGVEDYELLHLAKGKLQGKSETSQYWQLIKSVIERPTDYQHLESTRSWMLTVASR